MMKSLDALLVRWSKEGVDAHPPVSEEAVRATFSKLGITPAKDIIDLYGAIGGMDMMDNEYWRLWPLSEIEERRAEANEYGILFSDYCLDCWAYRVKSNGPESSAVFVDYSDGRTPALAAKSLDQFFSLYVDNARELLDSPNPKQGSA